MKGMVSKGKFQEIRFLAPSYDEQQDFGRFFIRVVDMMKGLEESSKESEVLFASLAQRAFSGEL